MEEKVINSERELFTVSDVKRLYDVSQVQVARWRKRTSAANFDKNWQAQVLAAKRKAELAAAANHRAEGTGENEWYTPVKYIEAARLVMGEIDLDPASNTQAQSWIKAATFFTKKQDGLSRKWAGKVWLNPPYEQPHIQNFAQKMVDEFAAKHVPEAVMLTHNYTDTAWFHLLEGSCAAICFTRGRIHFVNQHGDDAQPTQGQAFFYFGDRPQAFAAVFKQFGFVR